MKLLVILGLPFRPYGRSIPCVHGLNHSAYASWTCACSSVDVVLYNTRQRGTARMSRGYLSVPLFATATTQYIRSNGILEWMVHYVVWNLKSFVHIFNCEMMLRHNLKYHKLSDKIISAPKRVLKSFLSKTNFHPLQLI